MNSDHTTLTDLQDRTFAGATATTKASWPPERRLTADALASYLGRRAYAVIGTTREDGRAHAAMTSYVRRGTTFWLPTGSGSIRERNVRANPWTTLTICEGDRGDHIVVIIEGEAHLITPDEVPGDLRSDDVDQWASAWIALSARRLLSYAAEHALS